MRKKGRAVGSAFFCTVWSHAIQPTNHRIDSANRVILTTVFQQWPFCWFFERRTCFQLAVFNFGKKVNFQVKDILPGRPTNRQSIVLISDKRSTYD